MKERYVKIKQKCFAILLFTILFTGSLGLGFYPQPAVAQDLILDPLIKPEEIYGPPERPAHQASLQEKFGLSQSPQEIFSSSLEIANTRLPFIENLGQIDEEVKFFAKTFAGTVFVNEGGLTYSVPGEGKDSSIAGVAVREKFLTVHHPQLEGLESSKSKVNYFVGDEKNWRSNVPTYDSISLSDVWPQVNVQLKAYGNSIEKVFNIFPGGDVNQIKLQMEGITKLDISQDGELIIETELGALLMTKPIPHQIIKGEKNSVEISYVIEGTKYGFVV